MDCNSKILAPASCWGFHIFNGDILRLYRLALIHNENTFWSLRIHFDVGYPLDNLLCMFSYLIVETVQFPSNVYLSTIPSL